MDRRIMFVALGIAALALAGLAFAAGGQGWGALGFGPQGNGTGGPHDWNGTRAAQPGGWNASFSGRGMMRGGFGNSTGMAPPNMTAAKEAKGNFDSAVLSDDYATAKSLNAQYGFGNPIFGKLNETTFATYSQIASMEKQLRQELGLNATSAPPMGAGRMRGIANQAFEKGMRQGFRIGNRQNTNQNQKTNETQQQ